MSLYYLSSSESQESCADFTSIDGENDRCENECFATNRTLPEQYQSPAVQGVPSALHTAGLVYANSIPTTPKPAHLTIAAIACQKIEEQQRQNPPRGKNAKKSVKAVRAAHRKTVAWKRLPADERNRRVLDHVFRSESLAFTFNLAPKQEKRFRNEARPARALADLINRSCKSKLGRAVPLMLALEVSPAGRLHVHGVVTLEFGEWKTFQDILKSAGGKIDGHAGPRQTHTRKLFDMTGWADYIAKDFDRTAEALGTDKIVYHCRMMIAAARDEYDNDLARQKRHRTTRRAPRKAKGGLPSLTHSPALEAGQQPSMSQTADAAL